MSEKTNLGILVAVIAVIAFIALTALEFRNGSWERAIFWLLLATLAALAGKRANRKARD